MELHHFTNTNTTFRDINHMWNQKLIDLAYSAGIIQGRSTNHFVPDDFVTRAAASALIIRKLTLDSELSPLFK
ncbi:S-layer homology domain-containing protein [Paenibacillus taichungensis]|uniref:S-layer homology domain-containing protein n=1 Tax=Paenibacillus taichungensis TaxID=484184 RepID=UPI0035D9E289